MSTTTSPMTTQELLLDIFQRLYFPLQFMLASLSFLPGTLYSLLSTSNFSALTSISRIKDAWFARFWGVYGPQVRENASENGAKPMIQAARGVVLDIGPGSGEVCIVFLFSDFLGWEMRWRGKAG